MTICNVFKAHAEQLNSGEYIDDIRINENILWNDVFEHYLHYKNAGFARYLHYDENTAFDIYCTLSALISFYRGI